VSALPWVRGSGWAAVNAIVGCRLHLSDKNAGQAKLPVGVNECCLSRVILARIWRFTMSLKFATAASGCQSL
jgi:hypothetical protein